MITFLGVFSNGRSLLRRAGQSKTGREFLGAQIFKRGFPAEGCLPYTGHVRQYVHQVPKHVSPYNGSGQRQLVDLSSVNLRHSAQQKEHM